MTYSLLRRTGAMVFLGLLSCWGADRDADRFAGTWEARHEGVAFFTVSIQPEPKLTGRAVMIFVSADEDGNILEVRPEPKQEGPLENPAVSGNRLTFGFDGDNYAIALTGEGIAELRVAGAPASFRPFALERSAKP